MESPRRSGGGTKPSKKKTSSSRKNNSRKNKTVDSLGRKLTEKRIQRGILRWLETTGLLHWRQNSGVLFTGLRRVYLGPKGISDIIIVIPPMGMLFCMEIKKPKPCKTYQNKDQKKFETDVLAAGGQYKVIRSLEEAKQWLEPYLSKLVVRTGSSQLDPWS